MDPIVKVFTSAIAKLEKSEKFSEVFNVCRTIDALDNDHFAKHAENDNYSAILNPSAKKLTLLLIKYFKVCKTLSQQKIILKALLKPALCMNYFHVECLFVEYEEQMSGLGAELLRNYMWIHNDEFIRKFGLTYPNHFNFHDSFVESSLAYKKDTKYFEVAIENNIAAYGTSMQVKLHHSFKNKLLKMQINQFKSNMSGSEFDNDEVGDNSDGHYNIVILSNLENLHQNVRPLILRLFKEVMKKYDSKNSSDNKMMETIIKLPWTDRNKYSLLSIIISNDAAPLLTNKYFVKNNLLNGLFVALSFDYLVATSALLVKAVYKHEFFQDSLIKILAKYLWIGQDNEVNNIIKYWFNVIDQPFISKLYDFMSNDGKFLNIPTTSSKFYRLLVLRNAFKDNMKDPELDERIFKFALDIKEKPLKTEIFQIMINKVCTETDEDLQTSNISAFQHFIRSNMEDSQFVDHMMRKFPKFFKFLADKKPRKVEFHKRIFRIIKEDIFDHGMSVGTKESKLFSLKLFDVMTKEYFTNRKGSFEFIRYLEINKIWNIFSLTTIDSLIAFVSDDDINISGIAFNILVENVMKPFPKEAITNVIVERVHLLCPNELSDPMLNSFGCLLRLEICLINTNSLVLLFRHNALLEEHIICRLNCKKSYDCCIDCFNLENRKVIFVLDSINHLFTRGKLDIEQPYINLTMAYVDKLTSFLFDQLVEFPNLSKVKLCFISDILKSCSEVSLTASLLLKEQPDNCAIKYLFELNIQILTKISNKDAIKSASKAIGKATKIVSRKFLNFCNRKCPEAVELQEQLVVLKQYIDCGKHATSEDIDANRGLIILANSIITNHPPFLKFFMEIIIDMVEIKNAYDQLKVRFYDKTKPIQLHLLAELINDGNITEEMIPYYNFILLALFERFKNSEKSKVMTNVLIQIIDAIIPKISNQKKYNPSGHLKVLKYEPKSVTVYEFYVKFTGSLRVAYYDLCHEKTLNNTIYVVKLLELFSNFEWRNIFEYWSEMGLLCDKFEELMAHNEEEVRMLAGKCYAMWQEVDMKMLATIKELLKNIFDPDKQRVHSTINCVKIMIDRYESCVKFIDNDFDIKEFKILCQKIIRDEFTKKSTFVGATNFFIRYHILNFLMFLDFTFSDLIVQSLMIENNLESHFGYPMWKEEVKAIQMKTENSL
ncbi:CLUMA_CG009676, isoform A [Clunio marinus]|uniref:CLUMA_CG009676, isoform A n=1 Tax=Clunio marinus TaxID=568069 RepID=A0A1J1ICT1_9DIPT|nr:CLUMA_CG009676, isoform A [Clunio marinus]